MASWSEVLNSSGATCTANNVRLTSMGAQQLSMAAIHSHHAEEPTYTVPEMRDNYMITRKVHVDGNKLYPGKEWRLYAH